MQRSPGSPAFSRIAIELRAEVAAMAPHTLVASERELSERFGVSRMTARRAVALLESEGYVYRRPPRGTFVAEPRLTLRVGSFSDEVARLGLAPQAEVLLLESRKAGPQVAAELHIDVDEHVHCLVRLRSADRSPVAIETTYIPGAIAPDLEEHGVEGSIWELLRSAYRVTPVRSTARIESVPLDESASAQLGVRLASPGLRMTRHTFDLQERCVEFAVDTFRADRIAFEVIADLPTGVDARTTPR